MLMGDLEADQSMSQRQKRVSKYKDVLSIPQSNPNKPLYLTLVSLLQKALVNAKGTTDVFFEANRKDEERQAIMDTITAYNPDIGIRVRLDIPPLSIRSSDRAKNLLLGS
eukprot:gnl/Chilomastix_caulleri/6602.p1 GENE.gnl/Chilomastix_caulleri/6602~~gnl/Chilomastix_caulleri/6602.p1  ORF type:complete len:110 (+),score=29.03 gnl/Chilomastix_caulleri/6602:3-332(+)